MLEKFAAKDFNKDAYLLASLSSLIGRTFIFVLQSFKFDMNLVRMHPHKKHGTTIP